MSELPEGIDPEIFEDLHTSLAGISLSHVIHRPAELWEILQLVKADRAMVRGEIYRYDGLQEAYRKIRKLAFFSFGRQARKPAGLAGSPAASTGSSRRRPR